MTPFQCPGHILTQLSQPRSAATRASRGRLDDHALAGQVVWKGVAFERAPACKARHVRRRSRSFSGKLVLGGGRLGLFELQLHLVDQPGRALGTRPVDLTLEFGDPKFLMRDERQIVGSFRLRDGQLGGDLVLFCDDESGLHQGFLRLRPRAEQRLLQRLHIVGQSVQSGIHDRNGITKRRLWDSLKSRWTQVFRLAGACRPPSLLRISPIDRLEQIAHLRWRDRD